MDSVVNAIVAVAGTLLGSTATYLFQRSSTDRHERVARAERYRSERLAVYTEFAAAVTDLRRAAYDRWHRYQDDPESEAFTGARDEYYRLYTEARNVQIKLELLTSDNELVELAHQAVERATEIKDADIEAERVKRGESAKETLNAFVTTASARLR
jgi:hypothetical protein